MIVTRWQAQVLPSKEQMKMIMTMEGMEVVEEVYPSKSVVIEHRHPFDEVRMIVSGQLLYNVAGHKLLLRAGDRIVVPSNTKHETKVDGEEACVSLYAQRLGL